MSMIKFELLFVNLKWRWRTTDPLEFQWPTCFPFSCESLYLHMIFIINLLFFLHDNKILIDIIKSVTHFFFYFRIKVPFRIHLLIKVRHPWSKHEPFFSFMITSYLTGIIQQECSMQGNVWSSLHMARCKDQQQYTSERTET